MSRRVHLVGFLDDHGRFLVGYGLQWKQADCLNAPGWRNKVIGMVSVNGGMVPPFGGSQGSGGDTVGYSAAKGGKSGTVPANGGLRAKDKGADGKKNGDKPRFPKNRSLSIEKPKNQWCATIINIHIHMQAGPGCTQDDMAKTKEELEEAAKKWSQVCPCPEAEAGSVLVPGPLGCAFDVRIIWHDEPSNDAVTIAVDCKDRKLTDPDIPGEGQPGSGREPRIRIAAQGRVKDNNDVAIPLKGYYAHELGHNLFFNDPEGWSGGHNPDDKGIMRDTKKPGGGGGIGGGEIPTPQEMCELAKLDKALSCNIKECCVYVKAPAAQQTPALRQDDQFSYQPLGMG